jgi:hypothetical protein
MKPLSEIVQANRRTDEDRGTAEPLNEKAREMFRTEEETKLLNAYAQGVISAMLTLTQHGPLRPDQAWDDYCGRLEIATSATKSETSHSSKAFFAGRCEVLSWLEDLHSGRVLERLESGSVRVPGE